MPSSSAYTAWALSRSATPRVNCWSSIPERIRAEDGGSLLIASPETQRAREQVGSSSAVRRFVTMPAEKVILCRKPFLRKSHASAGFLQLFF